MTLWSLNYSRLKPVIRKLYYNFYAGKLIVLCLVTILNLRENGQSMEGFLTSHGITAQ